MARLYADENFPFPVVDELRRLGHDVLTIQEAGKANQEFPDDSVLLAATTERRALLTLNRRDFMRLHQQIPDHTGIIVCTADLDFRGQAQRIHDAVDAHERLVGALLRIHRPPTA